MRTAPMLVVGLGFSGVLGCGSTAPKDYPFEGVWTATGGALNGDTLNVTQSGDTVFGCLAAGSQSGSVSGSNAGGEVEFVTIVTSGDGSSTLPVFTGHFVNAGSVEGRVADGSSTTVTLTETTGLVPCQIP